MKKKISFLAIGALVVCALIATFATTSGVQAANPSTKGTSHNSPTIVASPTNALPGGTIAINGSNFTPGGTVAIASSNIAPVNGTADGLGRFNVVITVQTIPGAYKVFALDLASSKSASTVYQVIGTSKSTPSIKIANPSVNPGDNINVTGSKFTPYAVVWLYTSNGGAPVAANADAHGNIGATVVAPTVPNSYTLTAVDGSTSSKTQAKYTVL